MLSIDHKQEYTASTNRIVLTGDTQKLSVQHTHNISSGLCPSLVYDSRSIISKSHPPIQTGSMPEVLEPDFKGSRGGMEQTPC